MVLWLRSAGAQGSTRSPALRPTAKIQLLAGLLFFLEAQIHFELIQVVYELRFSRA